MANADEAFGQQVQQEAAQELIEGESHPSLFVFMGGVTPAKGNLVVA